MSKRASAHSEQAWGELGGGGGGWGGGGGLLYLILDEHIQYKGYVYVGT